VRTWERLPNGARDDLGLPDACFALTDTLVIFDNLRGTVKVVATVDVADLDDRRDPDRLYDDACERIEEILAALGRATAPLPPLDPSPVSVPEPVSRLGRAAYEAGVERIQQEILAGEAFQVVLSQRFDVPRAGLDPFDVYRALRVTNPSPYMFHLDFPEAVVTGASPETLVRLEGERVSVRPIRRHAAARATAEEDAALEADLRADPKERAEHVMLIDLGRNDVGRVSAPGSVTLPELMKVERYSHVMHLVSHVEGRKRPEVVPPT